MKKLSESVWGDIRKKSLGKEEREENDVNILDLNGLYEYIIKHYELLNEKSVIIYSNYLTVYICDTKKTYYGLLFFTYDMTTNESYIDFPKEIKKLFPEMFKKLNDKYLIIKDERLPGRIYNITYKDGEIDNKLFLDVIDIAIENIPEEYDEKIHITKK